MSAVAARAGIARQTLYNHFPDIATIPTAAGRLEHLVRHAAVTPRSTAR